MTGLDIFALLVLAVIAVTALSAWVFLAGLPGRIAQSRGHPFAAAIRVSGWCGAILGGVFWPLALIWAFAPPGGTTGLSAHASQSSPASQAAR
jgi:hypothetical protein